MRAALLLRAAYTSGAIGRYRRAAFVLPSAIRISPPLPFRTVIESYRDQITIAFARRFIAVKTLSAFLLDRCRLLIVHSMCANLNDLVCPHVRADNDDGDD